MIDTEVSSGALQAMREGGGMQNQQLPFAYLTNADLDTCGGAVTFA